MLSPVERAALVIVTLGLLGFIVFVVVQKSKCEAKVEKFFAASVPTPASLDDAAATLVGAIGHPSNGINGINGPKKEGFESQASVEAPACYPRDRLTAEDLLPKDAANSKWAQMNPAGQGDVQGVNFLSAAWQAGVDTQGSSLRNSSWDLRSEPPNPQIVVSPWQNSTIEPNLLRRPLEIGGDF